MVARIWFIGAAIVAIVVAGCRGGLGNTVAIGRASGLVREVPEQLQWTEVSSAVFRLRALSFLSGNFDVPTETRFDAAVFLTAQEKYRVLRRSVFERGGSLTGLGGSPAITVSWGVQVIRLTDPNSRGSAEEVFNQLAAAAQDRRYTVELATVRGVLCVIRKGREKANGRQSEFEFYSYPVTADYFVEIGWNKQWVEGRAKDAVLAETDALLARVRDSISFVRTSPR